MKNQQEQKIQAAIDALKAVLADDNISMEQLNNRPHKCHSPTGGLDLRIYGLGPVVGKQMFGHVRAVLGEQKEDRL